jgi:HlyD family secretion protein
MMKKIEQTSQEGPFSYRWKPFFPLWATLVTIVTALLAASSFGWEQLTKENTPATDSEKTTQTPRSPDVAVGRGRVDVEGGMVQLAASRDGIVHDVLVEEGATVKKGQILAILDPGRAELSLTLARKELDQLHNRLAIQQLKLEAAQREEARLSRLALKGAITGSQLDQVKDQTQLLHKERADTQAMLDTQRVRVNLARLDVDHMTVRAPADGLIVRRHVKPGEGVSTLNVTPLFWFAPGTQYIIRAELEDRFIHAVTLGMDAEVFFEGNPAPMKAKVIRLGKLFGPKRNPGEDPDERNDVRVLEFLLAPVDADARLILGQRALVRIKG